MKTPFSRSLLVVGLCSIGFTCQAQEAKTNPSFAKFYIEARLNRADYEVFYLNSLGGGAGTSPWLATIGRQLTSHWAVQLGYAYTHNAQHDNPAYTGTTLTGQQTYGWRNFDKWTHALPLTAHYTVSQPQSHLQIDIIGGITWVSTRDTAAYEDFVDGQSQGRHDFEYLARKQLYVTGALGVRYACSRHLEGLFDYGYARNLKWAPEGEHLANTGNKLGLTRSISLGMRYRFNLKKTAE